MKQKKNSEAESTKPTGHRVWKIVGGVALALVATGIITQFRDIRRYINMTRM